MSILDALYEIGRWSLHALWLPMLVWTAIALPVFAVQRWTPGISAHTRYWTALGLMASLPIGLFAGVFVAVDAAAIRDIATVVAFPGLTITTLESSAAPAFSWTLWHSVGALTIVACLLAVLRATALIAATREIRRFEGTANDQLPELVKDAAARLSELIGVDRAIRIVVSDTQTSPLTFGWRFPVIVLPRHLLAAPNDLRLSLAHEFVHIRRGDYLWQWCEHLIGALFFIHPLVAVLRNETSILREITCDADVLTFIRDRSRYARLLFHYSAGRDSPGKLAVGILLRENHLKKRIIAMKNLLDFKRLNRTKRTALTVSVALLVVAVAAVACSDVLVESNSSNPDAEQIEMEEVKQTFQQETPPPPPKPPVPVEVPDKSVLEDKELDLDASLDLDAPVEAAPPPPEPDVDQMPEIIGGLQAIQQDLNYPGAAKREGVEGRVIVEFDVTKSGTAENARIVQGVGSGLDEEALRVVRNARFLPAQKDGEPVAMKLTLPITFRLK